MSQPVDADWDLVRLQLLSDGSTTYSWRSNDTPLSGNVLEIKSSSSKSHKGVGVYNASSDSVPQSSVLFTNAAIAAATVQHPTTAAVETSPFCQRCLQFIPPKAMTFSHPHCRHFKFCSRTCLASSDHLLSIASPVIAGLLNNSALRQSPQTKASDDVVVHTSSTDTAVLLVLWSYALVHGNGSDTEQSRRTAQSARECLRLFAGHGTETDNQQAVIEAIVNEMEAHAPASFVEALAAWGRAGLTPLVSKMVRILRFNAQPMPVSAEGTGPTILFLVPSIPRLNHSCSPNVRLVLEAPPSSVASDPVASGRSHLQLSVIALRSIAPDEELTMSYLDNLCLSVATRRSLLQQGFAFRCTCSRCRWEESLASTSPLAPSSPPSKLSMTIRELHSGLQTVLHKQLPGDAAADQDASLDSDQLALLRCAHSLYEQLDTIKQKHKRNASAVAVCEFPGPFLQDVATAAEAVRPLVPEIATLLRDAAGIVLQNFAYRFQALQQRHRAATSSLPSLAAAAARSETDFHQSVRQYLSTRSGLLAYGVWFLRSGQLVALAHEVSDVFVGKASIRRLDIMVMTALYGAVTARAYVEVYDQLRGVFGPMCRDERTLQRLFLQALPSPKEMLETVRGGLNMAIDAILTIKTVFLTAANAAHRQTLGYDTAADPTAPAASPTPKPAFQDLWRYLEDLHARAWKAKRYCITVFEKVGELHDSFSSTSP
eukprot:gene9880-7078_t